MLIRCSIEHVTQEPCNSAQRSYNQSRPTPRHPRREACRQQIKSCYCQLASCKIVDRAQSNCQRDSCCCCNSLPSRRKIFRSLHPARNPNAAKCLTNQSADPLIRRSYLWRNRRPPSAMTGLRKSNLLLIDCALRVVDLLGGLFLHVNWQHHSNPARICEEHFTGRSPEL